MTELLNCRDAMAWEKHKYVQDLFLWITLWRIIWLLFESCHVSTLFSDPNQPITLHDVVLYDVEHPDSHRFFVGIGEKYNFDGIILPYLCDLQFVAGILRCFSIKVGFPSLMLWILTLERAFVETGKAISSEFYINSCHLIPDATILLLQLSISMVIILLV